jgi:two-component system, cell cycle sensor histidine kinase and response regulator CckA
MRGAQPPAGLIDRFPSPALVVDEGCRIVAANEAMAFCLATDAGALAGRALTDWAFDAAELRDFLRRGGAPREFRFHAQDGKGRWLLLALSKGAAGEGDLLGVADVTPYMSPERQAQIEAERAVEKRAERYRKLVEAASDWAWETDAAFRFTHISVDFERVTGWSPAQRLGKRPDESGDAWRDPTRWQQHMATLAAHRPFREFIYQMSRSDGRKLWIKVAGVPVFDGDGGFQGYHGASMDVTPHVEVEEAAKGALRDFRDAIEHIGQPLSIFDADGRLVTCNEAYRALHRTPEGRAAIREGASFREITEWRLANCFFRTPPAETAAPYEPASTGIRAGAGIYAYELSDGRSMLVDTRMRADGSTVSVWTDVSSIKEAEAKRRELETALYHANKLDALGRLAGGIAHDLNNTLVPVLALAKVTLGRLAEQSSERGNLELILRAAERARDLVKQILAFSRKEAPTRQPLDLAQVVEQSLKMLRASLPSTIAMKQKIAAVPPLLGDAGQLHQVITNLITNAAQAVGSGAGTITVELALEAARGAAEPVIRLSVADTGCGMPESVKERIFEPFFTTKPVGEGTGLGLSVVHGIVSEHGGRIAVESRRGRGTRIDVYLPAAPAAAASADGIAGANCA